jgi:short-subunit dehydrogenase involved in D-alanine esterification of teichoic acids
VWLGASHPRGARVFITGRRESEVNPAVAEIGNVTPVQADISSLEDLDRI